jgi:hypothetical protein
MKRKKSHTATIGIRKVIEEKGDGIHVQLVSRRTVWLPKNKICIRTDEYYGLLAEIPVWLKKKIDNELKNY